MSGIKDYICQEQKESHALLEWLVSRSQASSRSRTRCNQEDGLLLSCERFLAVGLRAFLPFLFFFLKLLTRFRVKNFPSSYELSEVLIDVSIFLAVTEHFSLLLFCSSAPSRVKNAVWLQVFPVLLVCREFRQYCRKLCTRCIVRCLIGAVELYADYRPSPPPELLLKTKPTHQLFAAASFVLTEGKWKLRHDWIITSAHPCFWLVD